MSAAPASRSRTLTFEDGGRAPGTTMLLRDRETGSLWSSLKGGAIGGPLKDPSCSRHRPPPA